MATRPATRKRSAPASPPEPKLGLRVERLTLENIRCFRELTLDFPLPRMLSDPDVHVIGSVNGAGKTTVLECIALLLSTGRVPVHLDGNLNGLGEWLVAGTAMDGRLDASVTIGTDLSTPHQTHTRGGAVVGEVRTPTGIYRPDQRPRRHIGIPDVNALRGLSSDPLIARGCLYFHSNRRVDARKLELRDVVGSPEPGAERSTGLFKRTVLSALLGSAGLLESGSLATDEALDQLNRLVSAFADGTIEKIRTGDGNTLDFRVTTPRGSFSFDALSSGQKEIISTLFLIWVHTKDYPSVVLIDEPELHLNAEWHLEFVYRLHQLVRHNQYILATHSEDVFQSVPERQRITLVPETEG